MLTIKYEKKSTASFVSHIDVLRTLGRIFARADVKVGFSEGFNPHMLIFCSPANAVGVNSECEYVTIASSEQKDICEKFNTFAPEGFKAVKHFVTEKNPNLAKHVTNAEYIFRGKGIGKADFNRLLKSDVFEISYEDKNGVKKKDFTGFWRAFSSFSTCRPLRSIVSKPKLFAAIKQLTNFWKHRFDRCFSFAFS